MYRLTTGVPNESGLAYDIAIVEIKPPESDTALPGDVVLKDIEPPKPVAVKLKLTSDFVNVSYLKVEWYESIDGESVLIGRSTSDANGKVRGLLPPYQSLDKIME
jgi:hypothetical protein